MDYYQHLEIERNASQQQVKQSYKRLALKHHPDKNQDKEKAKIKFTQISEAYSVLNDPEKRQNYDAFGVTDADFHQFQEFQQFMGDFGVFDDFLDDFLAFDHMNEVEKAFEKMFKGNGKGKKGGRAKKSNKGLDSLFESMMKEMEEAMPEEEEISSEDDGDLTKEEMLILEFGQKNIQKKKIKKKSKTICKLCSENIDEDQILIHFSQMHLKEFSEWQENDRESSEKVQTA